MGYGLSRGLVERVRVSHLNACQHVGPSPHKTFPGTHPLTQLTRIYIYIFSYRRMVCKAEPLSSNQKISEFPPLEGVTVLQQRSFLQYFLKDSSIVLSN